MSINEWKWDEKKEAQNTSNNNNNNNNNSVQMDMKAQQSNSILFSSIQLNPFNSDIKLIVHQ